MLPPLKRTVFVAKDISEQPDSPFLLAIGSGERRGYYAVDDWYVNDGIITFGIARPLPDTPDGPKMDIVYACKVDASWNILRRDLLEPVTEEDFGRHMAKEFKASQALTRELNLADEEDKIEGAPSLPIDKGTGLYL